MGFNNMLGASKARLIGGLITVCVTAWLTVSLTTVSSLHKSKAEDLAEIQHIKYGLLDATNWVSVATEMADTVLERLSKDPEALAKLEPIALTIVDAIVTGVQTYVLNEYAKIKPGEEPGLWTRGKRFSIELLFKKAVHPAKEQMAKELLAQIQDPNGQIQSFLHENLKTIKTSTTHDLDRAKLGQALTRHQCMKSQLVGCQKKIVAEMNALNAQIKSLPIIIMLLVFAFLGWCLFTWRSLTQIDIILLIIAVFILLLGGVLNPMMNIEAKIDEISFTVLGQTLSFTNQVVFFQSKSIFDVIVILTTGHSVDMVIVGVLIGLFSVGFPSLKLVASFVYYFDWSNLRKQKLVQFFALKSGKWSMADVFVIALFMAFIGFNGIIDSQLGQLAQGNSSAIKIAPNAEGTAFQSGVYLFSAFCVASLFISGLLEKVVRTSTLGVTNGPSTHDTVDTNNTGALAQGTMIDCSQCDTCFSLKQEQCPNCGYPTHQLLEWSELVDRLNGQK